MMNQRQLQYFLTACETGNIQQAADRLFVSRQGVSKILRELERELGASLFYRSPKGVEPTEFARELLPHTKRLLEDYEYIAGINTLARQQRSLVTVYALDHIMEYLTADFLLELRQEHPGMVLSMVESTDDEAINALVAHKGDFAITTGPVDNTKFVSEPLFFTHYCVGMRVGHPLAHKASISSRDMEGQQIISKGRAYSCFRRNMDKYILGKGVQVDILAEIADIQVALELLRRTHALYLGYDYMACMHRQEDIVWKPLEEAVRGQVMYLVYLRDSLPRKLCQDFQEFLTGWLPRNHKDRIGLLDELAGK